MVQDRLPLFGVDCGAAGQLALWEQLLCERLRPLDRLRAARMLLQGVAVVRDEALEVPPAGLVEMRELTVNRSLCLLGPRLRARFACRHVARNARHATEPLRAVD